MTREERVKKLKYLITCMKCEVSGKVCDDNCPTQYNAGTTGEIIENLEEIAKALEQKPRWIPISERLPNYNDIVLASTESDYEEIRVILTVYEAEEFWFNGKIKAWMPLPKPYEPKERSDKE